MECKHRNKITLLTMNHFQGTKSQIKILLIREYLISIQELTPSTRNISCRKINYKKYLFKKIILNKQINFFFFFFFFENLKKLNSWNIKAMVHKISGASWEMGQVILGTDTQQQCGGTMLRRQVTVLTTGPGSSPAMVMNVCSAAQVRRFCLEWKMFCPLSKNSNSNKRVKKF